MLALGSAGMVRELFFIPPRDLSMLRVGICMVLMLGPTAAWAWWRKQAEPSSPGPVSPSSSPP